jgi:hypothetical protein
MSFFHFFPLAVQETNDGLKAMDGGLMPLGGGESTSRSLHLFTFHSKSDARIVIFAVRLAYYTMLKSWSLMKVK